MMIGDKEIHLPKGADRQTICLTGDGFGQGERRLSLFKREGREVCISPDPEASSHKWRRDDFKAKPEWIFFYFLDIGAKNHTISIKQTNRKEYWTQIANAEFIFSFLFLPDSSKPTRTMHF